MGSSACPPQLGSRYFGFYRDGQAEHMSSHLVPLLDLINHADDPNAERGGGHCCRRCRHSLAAAAAAAGRVLLFFGIECACLPSRLLAWLAAMPQQPAWRQLPYGWSAPAALPGRRLPLCPQITALMCLPGCCGL